MKKKVLGLIAGWGCAFLVASWAVTSASRAGSVYTVTANPGDNLQAVFDSLPPSICVSKWDGKYEGWFELGAQPLAQRFRTPDAAMTAEAGFLMMKRAGAPGGQIWIQIETDPGGNGRGAAVSPNCISTKISASQPAQSASSNVQYAFPNGCQLEPDTEYWLVLEKDGAYDGGFSAGNTSVSWRTNGQEYVPCASWNNSVTSSTTGDCDKAVYDGSSGWTVTAGRDMVFGLGRPAVVNLNPGLYTGQAVTSAHRAFTSVLGAGRESTIWTSGQAGSSYWAFHNYFSCFMELADIGFDVGAGGATVTPLFILGASGNSIHDLSVNGSATALAFTSGVDTVVRDNLLTSSCRGLLLTTTADDLTSFNNNTITVSSINGTCGSNRIVGIEVIPGVTGHTGASNHFIDNTIEVNVYDNAPAYGLFLDGVMDGTRVERGRIEVNYLGGTTNQAAIGIYDISSESSRFKDVVLRVSHPNAGAGANTIGILTDSDSRVEFEAGEIKVTAGGGRITDAATMGAGDAITIRNTNIVPLTYENAGGPSTMDVSPAFGWSQADNDGATDVTVYGCTTSHVIYCWTDVASCDAPVSYISAPHTVTAMESGPDCSTDSTRIYCACVKKP